MSSPDPRPSQELPLLALHIIWFVLLSSVVIYGAVGFILRMKAGFPDLGALANTLLWPLAAVSALDAVVVLVGLRPFMARSLPYSTFCIIRWALSETVAIFGLTLFIFGASTMTFVGFLLGSLLLLALTMPSEQRRIAYQEAGQS